MLSGVALTWSGLPSELIDRHGLGRRVCDRGGQCEVQFLFAEAERVLPVWRDGRLEILRYLISASAGTARFNLGLLGAASK